MIGNLLYDLIAGSNFPESSTFSSIVFVCSAVLVCLVFVVMIDLVYRIFRHFWR